MQIVFANDCYSQIVYSLIQMTTVTKNAIPAAQQTYLNNFGSYSDGQALVTSLSWPSFTGNTTQ
jgi:hypothetical protein